MDIGTVKWFNNAKGYGFILPENGGEDLFAHYSSITMEGYKTLKAGQLVSFDTIPGDKGLHAITIHTITEEQQKAFLAGDTITPEVSSTPTVEESETEGI